MKHFCHDRGVREINQQWKVAMLDNYRWWGWCGGISLRVPNRQQFLHFDREYWFYKRERERAIPSGHFAGRYNDGIINWAVGINCIRKNAFAYLERCSNCLNNEAPRATFSESIKSVGKLPLYACTERDRERDIHLSILLYTECLQYSKSHMPNLLILFNRFDSLLKMTKYQRIRTEVTTIITYITIAITIIIHISQ